MVRISTFSMSSNGNNNVSSVEPDDMAILVERLLPNGSDDDTAVPDQIATAVDPGKTNNTTVAVDSPRVVRAGTYHSTCPPRFIPEAARNMSWNDPFYVDDNEVIAVFDLNANMSCGRLLSWPGFFYVVFGGYLIFGLLSNFEIFDSLITVYWLVVILWIPVGQCLLQMERNRILNGYKHVAIARQGIYLDESIGEAPDNFIHVRRTMIKYEDIKVCYITSFLGTYSYYDVAFKYKKGCFRHRRIHGNFETQKFVDIVNAKIAESNTIPILVA